MAERVIRALTEESLLDDSRFAAQWKESRDSNKPRSAAAIRRELASHGVARDTAEAAVADIDDQDAAYRAALRLAQRLEREDYSTFQRKLWGHLKRRGFTDSIIRRAISRLWDDVRSSSPSVNEHQLSPKSPLPANGEELSPAFSLSANRDKLSTKSPLSEFGEGDRG